MADKGWWVNMGAFSKIVKNLFEDFGDVYKSNIEGGAAAENLNKKYGMNVPPKLSDLTSFRNTKLFKDVSDSVKSDITKRLGPDPSGLMPKQSNVDDAAANIFDTEVFGAMPNTDYLDHLRIVTGKRL